MIKVGISYSESTKDNGRWSPLEEVFEDDLTVEDERSLFNEIIKTCKELGENKIGGAYYQINLYFEGEETITLGYHVLVDFVYDGENICDIQEGLENKAYQEFCKVQNIDYDRAKEEICKLDYIEEEAEKQGIFFPLARINKIYDGYVESLENAMFESFKYELKEVL